MDSAMAAAAAQIFAVQREKETKGDFRLAFGQIYQKPPIVLVTSSYKKEVGTVETVKEVRTDGCVITSGSYGDGYNLNIMVIDSALTNYGGLSLQVGSVSKPEKEARIALKTPLPSNYPTVILTPASTKTVSYVEGVKTVSAKEIVIASSNINSQVNYAVCERGMGTVDGQTLMAGIVQRPTDGIQRVFFAQPFASPPVVCLSIWYDNAVASLHRPTVTATTNEYFEYVLANGDHKNLFCEWMAFGQLQKAIS
jgi:hypothetical protein